jgi:hypothetical protein
MKWRRLQKMMDNCQRSVSVNHISWKVGDVFLDSSRFEIEEAIPKKEKRG